MLKNTANSFDGEQEKVISEITNNNIRIRKVKKFNIINYIDECLLPQNSVEKDKDFDSIISGINSGNCALFVDSINIAFDIDVKGFKDISIPDLLALLIYKCDIFSCGLPYHMPALLLHISDKIILTASICFGFQDCQCTGSNIAFLGIM